LAETANKPRSPIVSPKNAYWLIFTKYIASHLFVLASKRGC
jgi:hypothetical protein